jgi:hypothetical protein
MIRRIAPVTLTSFAAALLIISCRSDSITSSGSIPERPGETTTNNLAVLTCTAQIAQATITCGGPAGAPSGTRNTVIIGGQHVNVDLISSNIINDSVANNFAFDVKVKNLMSQTMGTSDGLSPDSSISVFFHSGPTATGGSGIVSVANATGIGAFTGGAQPYYRYGDMLFQNSASANRNWILHYDEGVTSFQFLLLISANLSANSSDIVFVSKSGSDTDSCGSIASPCLSITKGTDRALALTRHKIFIAAGTYTEAVTLRNGISLYGGYSSDFTTRTLANRATINGSAQYLASPVFYTVIGENLTTPSVVDMLLVQGANASGQHTDGSGRHSVGVFLNTIASGVITISNSRITAGNGSDGLGGAAGTDATQTAPTAGSSGGFGDEFTTTCNNLTRGGGGAAGGSGASKGGKGGDGGTMDTNCGVFSSDFNARPGSPGDSAATYGVGFGNGGLGGSGGDQCGPTQPGVAGRQTDGANGVGGSTLSSSAGILVIAPGSQGSIGEDGTGGGGGGGAGGCDVGTDAYGSGGGGGGGGGAKAPVAGTGGQGGGASIAIYLASANATLTNVEIFRGNGGIGGIGGAGGKGQPGSSGALGTLGPGTAISGKGGDGANGGYAGAGGGGAGGISTGILKLGTSATTEASVTVSGGAGGSGGLGGPRGDSTSGAAGSNGSLTTSTSVA